MKENKEIEKFVESLSEDFNLSDKGEQTIREVFARVHNNALKMVEDEAVPIVDVPYMSDGKPEYWKGRNEVIESVINNIQKLKI
jgi:hypothetical protein